MKGVENSGPSDNTTTSPEKGNKEEFSSSSLSPIEEITEKKGKEYKERDTRDTQIKKNAQEYFAESQRRDTRSGNKNTQVSLVKTISPAVYDPTIGVKQSEEEMSNYLIRENLRQMSFQNQTIMDNTYQLKKFILRDTKRESLIRIDYS